MKKVIIITLALIILAGGIFAAYKFWPREKNNNQIKETETINYSKIQIGGKEIQAEVADNEEARMKGLSGRESLDEGKGMLFIFEKPDIYPFWMKEMKFSIDIIWLKDKKITEIINSAEPPTANGRTVNYTPRAEADMVLEVKAGFCAENKVKIGDSLEIK